MVWLDTIINVIWPIITAVAPIIFGGGLIWLRSQFVSHEKFDTKIDALSNRVDEHVANTSMDRARIERLEQDSDSAPTRLDLLEKLSDLTASMSAVQADNRAFQRQIATLNDYLHTLVEKGLK